MRKLLFLLTLLVAPSAWAQNGLFYAIDPPAPGANLLVCPLPTAGPAPNPCTTAAPIYNDIGLTMPAPNPVTLTQSGTYAFWAAAGQYVIQLSGSVNRTYVISLGGAAGSAGTLPRLDQVLNQNQNKLFNQGTASLGFTNGSFSLAGETAPLALPSINSCSPTVGGQICFDPTATNYLAYNGGVQNFALFPSTVTSGDLAGYLLVGGKWTLQDLGPPSGSSTGSFIKVDITNAQVDDSVCVSSLGPPIVWVNCTEGVPVNVQSGASYTIDCTTDRGSYIILTSSSAIAVSLPQAGVGACDANFFTYIRTLNAVATVTPTTSTIDDGGGAGATLLVQPGYGTNVFSDNTNYFAKIGPYREDSHGLMNVEGFDVNSLGAYQWQSPNNGTTGTTANNMACDDGTGKEIICSHTTAAADVPDGVAVSGVGAAPGTTGNVGICIIGYCSVVFDNSATANHYAQVSTSVDGDLTDVGTAAPTNGQPYYKIFTGNAGAGTQGIIRDLTPSELSATQVGGGGKTTVQVNGVSTQPVANFANGGGVTWSKVNSGNTSTITATVAGGGVTSLTGDGQLFSNSASTGAVTLTPVLQSPNTVFAGPLAASESNFVQSAGGATGSASSLSVAFPSPVGAGHLLVAVLAENGFTSFGSSNNTWTLATSGSYGFNHRAYYTCNSVAGADTVTVNTPASAMILMQIYEFSGNATSSCLDLVQNGPNGGAAAYTITSGGSIAQATELVFSYAIPNNGASNPTFTMQTPYLLLRSPSSITSPQVAALGGTLNSFSTGLSGTQSVTYNFNVTPAFITGALLSFKLNTTGTAAGSVRSLVFQDLPSLNTINTQTNCSSSAAPAVCGSAAAGSVVVAAAGTTVVVDTTAVTTQSQILLTFDSSLGTKLGVTCNATEPALYGVSARTAGTSFTITSSSPSVNPACFSYLIVN